MLDKGGGTSKSTSSGNVFSNLLNSLKNLVSGSSSKQTSTNSNLNNTGSVYSAPNNPVKKTTTSTPVTNPYGVSQINVPKVTTPTRTNIGSTAKTIGGTKSVNNVAKAPTTLLRDNLTGKAIAPQQRDYTPVDLTKMGRNEQNATMQKYGIPLVYNPDYANQLINTMNGKGVTYNDAKTLVNEEKMNNLISGNNLGNDVTEEEDKNSKYTGNGANGLGSNGGAGINYNDIMSVLMEQNDAARNAALDAILSNLDAVRGTYKNQIQDVIDQYQQLINENEINRERTRRRIREDQANRGQLDSGLGRQERLNLDTTYDTNTSNLESAREKAVNEIMTLIAQAEAEANQNRANVENAYNDAKLQYMIANQ